MNKSLFSKRFSFFNERILFQFRIYEVGANKDDLYFSASFFWLEKKENIAPPKKTLTEITA